jgi:hypothetical protein
MGNNTRNVRYPNWIKKAVADFAKKNGFSSESKAFIWLLSTQLNRYNYFEEKYTEKMVDKPMHERADPPGGVVPMKMIENAQETEQKKASGN